MTSIKMLRLFVLLLATTLIVISSCKKDKDETEPNTPPVYTNGQGEIGSAGGTVMIDDDNSPIDGASIVIPEGALNSNINIKIVEVPNEIFPPGDSTALLIGFEPEGLVFDQPVEISIPFKSGMNTSDIRVFYYNPDSMLVEQVPVVSYNGNFVTAKTNHFSYYYATDEGFILGIEMLNIDGKIGARVTNMGFDWVAGMDRIPSTRSSYDNAFQALVNSDNDVFSIFKAYLYKDGFFNSMESVSNLTIKRDKNFGVYKADVYNNDNFVYTSDALGTEPNGLLNTWFSGDPLIFYFDNFTPDANTSYFIKIKWRLHSNDNIDYWPTSPYTALYEVNNEDADKKLSEMGSFAFGDLFEECIDEQYINGSGLKPGVITNEASLITCSSARLNGTLDNLGSGQITQHGFCLSETPSPTVNDEHVINLGAIDELGSFNYDYSFVPPHLLPNTQYYYRAYAENSAGVAYGEDITFWTSDDSEAPTFYGYEPAPNSVVNGNVNIIISVLDECGLDKVIFSVKQSGGSYVNIGDDLDPEYIQNNTYHGKVIWNTTQYPNGNYTIRAWACDNAGNCDEKEWEVTVNNSGSNTPPTALFTVSPSSGTTSTNFAFDASGCTDNETPTSQLQVRWDFDGNGSWDTNWDTDKTQNHQYSTEATYTAKLEVKDIEGLTDQYTKNIIVSNGGGGFNDVTNPATGQTWMDRNLGASRAATSSTDDQAYGDLYQWGRDTDGHEKRNSGTTSTLSNSDTPGHGNFITVNSSPVDWRSPQNNNLWQGVSGTNNPCPAGYRLPTEAEWEAERQSWSSNNAAGAFNSPLKLPVAGYRFYSNGSLSDVGSYGGYWSATVDGTNARNLTFYSSIAYMSYSYRALGYSVRCLKD